MSKLNIKNIDWNFPPSKLYIPFTRKENLKIDIAILLNLNNLRYDPIIWFSTWKQFFRHIFKT